MKTPFPPNTSIVDHLQIKKCREREKKQERVALQKRKESSFYKKLQASDNKYQIASNR